LGPTPFLTAHPWLVSYDTSPARSPASALPARQTPDPELRPLSQVAGLGGGACCNVTRTVLHRGSCPLLVVQGGASTGAPGGRSLRLRRQRAPSLTGALPPRPPRACRPSRAGGHRFPGGEHGRRVHGRRARCTCLASCSRGGVRRCRTLAGSPRAPGPGCEGAGGHGWRSRWSRGPAVVPPRSL
jgi:hypothetical protein